MIEVRDLTVRAGNCLLDHLQFSIPDGQYTVLMGASGSGKTTLLETLCGLRPVAGGQIRLNGRDVTRWRPAERGIGYVPQDGALFPTLTVYEHLAFGPRLRRIPRAAMDHKVKELAALLGLEPLLGRWPEGLSGGERQRVALGRALAIDPAILCLDEPLNALDEQTHRQLCGLLKTIQRQTRVTTLHVTHDSAEARQLADQLLILKDGKVAPGVLAAPAEKP